MIFSRGSNGKQRCHSGLVVRRKLAGAHPMHGESVMSRCARTNLVKEINLAVQPLAW